MFDKKFHHKSICSFVTISSCIVIILISCQKDNTNHLIPDAGEELSAGALTVFDESPNAFGNPIRNLSGLDELNFFVGNSFFNQSWVSAPATTTARDGLGPMFNARSCAGCHFKDGRGRAPLFDGEASQGFLIRLSVPGQDAHGGPKAAPNYGGQLQDRATGNIPPEASIGITYESISGTYADGESYTLRKPIYHITNPAYGALDPNIMMSPRVGNQMIGLGLLEAISTHDLLANEDPLDSNGDGISGRANYVWNTEEQSTNIGRFGWKANQPNLRQQVAGAFNGDLGITSSIFPNQNCTDTQEACNDAPDGGSPEIENEALEHVVLYSSTLAVPARRNWDDSTVLKGKKAFEDANCNGCHIQKFTTGIHPDFAALSNQTIRPYTDLLLHDMGDELSDNRPDFLATGNEWRTPPLWGIGLFDVVNNHTEYLHDGRAKNLTDAILWHGGEAENSVKAFKEMPKNKRLALIEFLNSL